MAIFTASRLKCDLVALECDVEIDTRGVNTSFFSGVSKKESSLKRWLNSVVMFRRIKSKIESYDIVIVYLERSLLGVVFASFFVRKRKVKIIFNVESDLEHKYGRYGPIIPFLLKMLYQRVSHLVFKTSLAKQRFESYIGQVDVPMSVVHNPVMLNSEKSDTRYEYLFDSCNKYMLSVGRLHKTKGLSFMLRIFFELKQVNKYFKLVIVGTGPELKLLQCEACRFGFKLYSGDACWDIVFIGEATAGELMYLYGNSDVLISTSHSESFGLTIIEALASNLPVVCSDFGGVLSDIACESVRVLSPTPAEFDDYDFSCWIKEIVDVTSSSKSVECSVLSLFDVGRYEKSYKGILMKVRAW